MEADSAEHRVRDHDKAVVQSQPPERQATNVAPMVWVLGISTTLTIVGFVVVWLTT